MVELLEAVVMAMMTREAVSVDLKQAVMTNNEYGHRINKRCPLCENPVDHNDPNAWKQVRGWVGGPKKDSMRLREDTGYFAHPECVEKVQQGQAPDQATVFAEAEDNPSEAIEGDDLAVAEGLFDDNN